MEIRIIQINRPLSMPYGRWAAHDAYNTNLPISVFVAIEFWAMATKFLFLPARTKQSRVPFSSELVLPTRYSFLDRYVSRYIMSGLQVGRENT